MANIIHVKKGDQVVVISGKDKGAEGKVMTRYGTTLLLLVVFPDAWTECHGSRQCQHTSTGMNHRGTSKIVESQLREPSSTPSPMA